MEADISVIVPVYNVEAYVEKCIRSLINQSYRNIEIVLVDDGSTDRSGVICDQYAAKDPRIHVIHKTNGGLSDARNAGIEKAAGRYLFLLDSDDFITEDALKTLYLAAITEKADMVVGGYQKVDDKDSFIEAPMLEQTVLEGTDVSDYYFGSQGDVIQKTTAWGKLYYLPALKNHLTYPKGKIHEDEFVAHKLWLQSKKVIVLDKALYNYRVRPNSIVSSSFSIKRLDAIEAVIDRLEYVEEYKQYIPQAWNMCLDTITSRKIEYYSKSLLKDKRINKQLRNYQKRLRRHWHIVRPFVNDRKTIAKTRMTLYPPYLYTLYAVIMRFKKKRLQGG